jgi:hypothetical protein
VNSMTTHEGIFSKMTLKAAVIYDDFDFAARATALLDRAAIRTDEAMKWDVKPWRLNVLKQPSLADAALGETIGADLIMVALRKTLLLPDELKDWLESWTMKRQVEDAAMMLFCPEEKATAMWLWDELKEFAEWHNLLFLGSRNLQDDSDSMAFVNRLWQWKQTPQPVGAMLELFAESARSTRHWGINK